MRALRLSVWLSVLAVIVVGERWMMARTRALRQELQSARSENRRLTDEGRRNAERKRQAAAALDAAHGRNALLLHEIAARESRKPKLSTGRDDGSAPGPRPFLSAANLGRATPLKAFETALWATYHGDVPTLAAMLSYDGHAQEIATKLFSSLPPDAQSQFHDPAYLTALLIEYDAPSSGTYEVRWSGPLVGQTGVWLLGTQMVSDSGQVRNGQVALREADNAWAVLVPPGVMAHLGALLAPP